ncbi:MAG: hypothetical protein QOF90_204, partial [Acetobacteraceae bacterium]|nr:hypothetical protein [Acetobacteraceae bacterium]
DRTIRHSFLMFLQGRHGAPACIGMAPAPEIGGPEIGGGAEIGRPKSGRTYFAPLYMKVSRTGGSVGRSGVGDDRVDPQPTKGQSRPRGPAPNVVADM